MRRRRHAQPRFLIFVSVLLLIAIGTAYAIEESVYRNACERTDALAAERFELSETVSDLNDQLEYVKTDDYVIRTARDELNMVMPGEIRYVAS